MLNSYFIGFLIWSAYIIGSALIVIILSTLVPTAIDIILVTFAKIIDHFRSDKNE